MFIGTMEALAESLAQYPPAVRTALQYLEAHDFTTMETGSYEVAPGITANLDRYTTREAADCRPEAHEKFLDVQYLVTGEEFLGWCPLSPDLAVAVPYDAARDVIFYQKMVPDSRFILQPGSFAVLFPEDVHEPQMATDSGPAPVTKVVVKIAVSLL